MRRPFLATVVLGLLVAACGGGGEDETAAPAVVETVSRSADTGAESSLPPWMEPHLAADGPEVALVFSTSDYGVGENRIGFLVVRSDGSLVQAPRAEVLLGGDGAETPARTAAILEPVGPHSHPGGEEPHDHLDATDLYVAHVRMPAPGRYWVLVQPDGEAIQGIGTLDVQEETASIPVGGKAVASENPTLADAPAEEITTASPPDTELLRHSIAGSLADGVPFVVVFATPQFCQSRTCGPTVEVVEEVRRRIGPSVRFIHVEIYEDNDPQKGPNRWVEEWRLPSEPFVFLVGADGLVRAKFEGSVSVGELEDAVRRHVLSGIGSG